MKTHTVIDGNAFYEIDDSCYEELMQRKKEAARRMEQEKDAGKTVQGKKEAVRRMEQEKDAGKTVQGKKEAVRCMELERDAGKTV